MLAGFVGVSQILRKDLLADIVRRWQALEVALPGKAADVR